MFRKLLSFDGRINRAKMWLFYLLSLLALAPAFGLEVWLTKLEGLGAEVRWPMTPAGAAVRVALAAWLLIFLYVFFAVIVKRFHDRGKSAAWLALFFGIPIAFFAAAFFVGWPPHEVFPGASGAMHVFFVIALLNNLWYLLELLFLRGTRGDNRFGPDPLADKRTESHMHTRFQ